MNFVGIRVVASVCVCEGGGGSPSRERVVGKIMMLSGNFSITSCRILLQKRRQCAKWGFINNKRVRNVCIIVSRPTYENLPRQGRG